MLSGLGSDLTLRLTRYGNINASFCLLSNTASNLWANFSAILLCEFLLIMKRDSCSSYSLSLQASSELFCPFSSGIRCRIGWAHNRLCPDLSYQCSFGRYLNSLGVRRVPLILRKAMNRMGVVLIKAYLIIA